MISADDASALLSFVMLLLFAFCRSDQAALI